MGSRKDEVTSGIGSNQEKNAGKVDIRKNDAEKRVIVGMATCGIAAGARPVLQAFVDEVATRGLSDVVVSQTGCIGVCRLEPIAEVFMPGQEKVTYVKMDAEKSEACCCRTSGKW